MSGFRDAGCTVLGISRDRPASQKSFSDRNDLDYPMLSDVDGSVCRAYGVLGGISGVIGFAQRVSFLIDAAGIVSRVYDSVSPSRHAQEVLEDVRELGESS